MPHSATLCCDPPWSEPCSETSWPCCMRLPWKSEPSEVAEKPLFYCAAARDCRTHVGVLEWRILFTERPVRGNFVSGKTEANCSEQGCWVSFPGSQSVSRTQKQRSLRLSPAVINTFVEKAGQLSKAGACSVAFVLCKLGALSRYTQTFCLLPVNNAFVFLKEKNAIAFVELRICLMSSVLRQRLCKDHSVKKK